MKDAACVVGIDFGTDSVRSIVADATTGGVLGTSVKHYPRWAKGLHCAPVENRFRQHPLDHLESMEASVREALGEAGSAAPARVRGIAVDTTGSTPALADHSGTPLALSPRFAENPNAMFVLWKDHTAIAGADRLNDLARAWNGADYMKYVGGTYSSEWFAPPATLPEKVLSGICGQVDGSVIPGLVGYEAGQSAFGDVYAWFKALLSWPLETILPAFDGISEELARDVAGRTMDAIIPALEQAAAALNIEETALVALDWMNGRRTPHANQRLTGALTGLRLGTDAPRIYRSLVEATAFGSRAIVECFRAQGTRIDSAIAIGGVAKKSPFAMQTIADVLNLEDLAGMLGVEHVRIGHGKDLGALKNELRWNDRPAR